MFNMLQINCPKPLNFPLTVHVDLGSGATPRNPFNAKVLIATDFSRFASRIENGIEFRGCDLTRKLPFEDNSITSISAYDVLEHIPRWERLPGGEIVFPFINLMSEIYRILVPGGQFLAVTPGYPSPAAFVDPTHINFITTETMDYFCGDDPHASTLGYGFKGSFNLKYQDWLRGSGPYAPMRIDSINFMKSKVDFVNSLRMANRYIRYLRNRKPSHLITILEKY